MSEEYLLQMTGIHKRFGGVHALNDVTLRVRPGKVMCLAGENGCGKSTLVKIISGVYTKDEGTVTFEGKEITKITPAEATRLGIQVIYQDLSIFPNLTVRENLEIRASMYGLKDVRSAVERAMADADCTEFSKQRYGTLSGGQRRRADIARALVHSPRVLILDEPTSGLDPHTRKVIWESVFRLNRQNNMTVLLTTHYMEEAANADDVVVIDHGRIVAHGTPEELRERYSRDRMTVVPKDVSSMKDTLDSLGVTYSLERDVFTIELGATVDAIPIIDSVRDMMVSFEVRMGSMDDAFVSITGGEE